MASTQTPNMTLELKRGYELHKAGRLDEAAATYAQIIAADPGNADALHLLGSIKAQRGAAAEGCRLIEAALKLKPDVALMWFNHGNALAVLERRDEAVESYRRAVGLAPDMVVAHYSLCGQLTAADRAAEALRAMDEALAAMPGQHLLVTGKANALMGLHRAAEALACYDAAVAAAAHNVDAISGRGIALNQLGRPREALVAFDQALALVPGHLDSILGRCHSQVIDGAAADALPTLDKVLAVVPNNAVAHYIRGHGLLLLHRTEEAATSFASAAELAPTLIEAVYNHADCLRALARYDEAIPAFERVLTREPDHAHAMSGLAVSAMQCCDWMVQEQLTPRIEQKVREGSRGLMPFSFLSMSSSKELQLACSKAYIRNTCPLPAMPFQPAPGRGDGRLRIGYLSSDFRRHAMAYQMVELFEIHDRKRFEVIGFSGGPDDGSAIRKRIERAVDTFHDVAGRTSEDVARLVLDSGIDVAVDLNGNTLYTLVGALAWRPARVQATYLGFPGTSGASFVDYVIADDTVAPLADQAYFTERIVHLPGCYQVSDSQRKPSPTVPSRASQGLPADAFVFCCFNTSYKISREVFDVWMRILQATPGSVLWLVRANDRMVENLRQHAAERGVDPGRLVFCGTVEPADHLARHALADLYLDTLPYNSHGTGSFALWGGLPMLTCLGPTFAGRVAASLSKAVGMPELVTENFAAYEALAIALARDRTRLAAIRAKLARNLTTAPLFDTDLFRRHIEAAYATMHEIALLGEPPRSFAVPSLA